MSHHVFVAEQQAERQRQARSQNDLIEQSAQRAARCSEWCATHLPDLWTDGEPNGLVVGCAMMTRYVHPELGTAALADAVRLRFAREYPHLVAT